MPPRLARIVALLVLAPAMLRAQDSALTRLLVANRHPIRTADGKLDGTGGRLLVDEGTKSRFVLVGEEHGIAQTPQVVQALLAELRPAGYNTLAIEVSPLQGQRLDLMARRARVHQALDTMLGSWITTPPFYSVAEERSLLESAMTALGAAAPMRIWGLDYEVSADRFFLQELEALAPATGKAAIRRSRDLAQAGFAAVSAEKNPSKLFTWSAPDSVFEALRGAFPKPVPPRAREIIDVLERSARINRLFLGGDGYQSNLMRSAYLRENFARAFAAGEKSGPIPRVLFKFGGSHMMRGFNASHALDVGTAADVTAEARGERAYHVLIVGGTGSKAARMNILSLQYEPAASGEIDAANLAWLKPAVPVNDWVLFDLRTVRAAYVARRAQTLTVMQDRYLQSFDAIVVLTGSTPGTPAPLIAK